MKKSIQMMKLRQRFEPYRQLLFSALMLLAVGMAMTACSSEEDVVDIDEESGDIKLNFSLLNENGKESTIFKEGENVCFDLEIVNKGNSDFVYCLNFDGGDLVLGKDFFCVYTEKGERIGTPWTGMFCEMSLQKEWHIPAKTTYHVRCSWLGSSIFTITHPLCKFESSPYLAPGVYEAVFDGVFYKLSC